MGVKGGDRGGCYVRRQRWVLSEETEVGVM